MADTMSYLEGGLNFAFIFEDKKDMFDRYSVALTLEGDQVKEAEKLGLKVKQEVRWSDEPCQWVSGQSSSHPTSLQ